MKIRNDVTRVPPASSEAVVDHFDAKLAFETDCWDVHQAGSGHADDFVLVDVRAPERFARRHVPGAVNIQLPNLTRERLAAYPDDMLFVVYCNGPHCNGADKAARRLAQLSRPVKVMIGGITGWQDEGFAFEAAEAVA